MTHYEYIRNICYESLKKKNLESQKYIDRLEYELFVIKTLGFIDYFLLLADIIHWSKQNNILVGPARGSAGASIISYLLGITNIDPIKWNLPFERFLNPGRAGIIDYDFELPNIDKSDNFNFIDWYNEHKIKDEQFDWLEEELGRLELSELQKFQIKYMYDNNIKIKSSQSAVLYNLGLNEIKPTKFIKIKGGSAPDIDTDVPRTRRHEIIEHIIDKYGSDYVAAVSAYNMVKSRQCIRDAGRALNKPYKTYDMLSKKIPLNKTLKDIIEEDKEFKQLYEIKDDMLMLALGLENTINAVSTHAAGIIISNELLIEHCPLLVVHDKKHKHSYNLTAWDKDQVEEIGLLKLDLLGLKTLDILETTYKFIKEKENTKDYNVNELYDIPLDDKETFELINNGKTNGIFQISSSGMTKLAQQLKVNNIHDMALLVALYRPGPLESGMVDNLIKIKNGELLKQSIDPSIDYIFENTYSAMVYQEQLMEMLIELAGYSMAEADKARKGFAKKNEELFNAVLQDALEKMNQRGYGYLKEKITNMLKGVARYLFNKSHSYAYGLLGYYTAYYKTHYPLEFIAATLEFSDTPEELQEHITRFTTEGYKILPPDIKYSKHETIPDYKHNGIRLGYKVIKGVSKKAARALVRISKKKIENINDFLKYTLDEDITTKDLKAICYVGILDSLISNRKSFIENIDNVIKQMKEQIKAKDKIKEWEEKLKLKYEEKIRPWEIELEQNSVKYAGKNLDKEQKKYLKKIDKFKSEFPTLKDYIENNSNIKKWKAKLEVNINIPELKEYDNTYLYQMEKEHIGMYVSGSPINDEYKRFINYLDIKSLNELNDIEDGSEILILGLIEKIIKRKTRNDNEFYILNVYTVGGSIDITVWPNTVIKYNELLKEHKVLLFEGKLDTFNDRKKIILNKIVEPDSITNDMLYSYAIVPIKYFPLISDYYNGLPVVFEMLIDDYKFIFDSIYKYPIEELKKLENIKFK